MFWSEPSSLVLRIAIGVLLGVVVALLFPSVAVELGLLGTLFVGLL
jgi:Na+/serine symporter